MPNDFLQLPGVITPESSGFSRASNQQLEGFGLLPGIPETNPTQNKINLVSKTDTSKELEQAKTMSQDEFFNIVDNAIASGNFELQSEEEVYNGMLESVTQDGITVEGITPTSKQVEQGGDMEEEKISGFDLGVKTGEFLSKGGQKFKFQSNVDDGIIESGAKFIANLPGNTVQLAGDIVSIASDPVGTIKSLNTAGKAIVEGALNKIFLDEGEEVFTTKEIEQVSNAIGNELSKIATEPGRIKELLVENPADVLLTITGGVGQAKNLAKSKNLTGLANKLEKIEKFTNPIKLQAEAGKVIKKGAGFIAKEVPSQLIGKTTGAGAEAIKTAFKKGGEESFGKALRGEITDEDILNSAKKGFETIKEQRAEVYGDNYAKLTENKTKLGTTDIEDSLIKTLEDNKVKIVPTKEGFNLDFGESTITQKASQNQIKEMFDDVIYWTDDTPEGLDVLKQRVQDRWIGGEGTGKADRMSTILSNKIKDKVVSEVPEYAEMTAKYEKITNELKEIDKVLRIGNDKNKMTAITRLGQSMKDNLSFRKEMVTKLEELSGIDIKSAIAGASLRDVLPKGLIGSIAPTGIGYGVGAGIFTPTLVPLLLTSSPRVIGELARAIGVTTNVLKKGLINAKELFKIVTK